LDVRPTAQDTINFNLLFPIKVFEKILEQQLSDFFENIFNPYLCAYLEEVMNVRQPCSGY
jgi:hypothetical protein